MLIREIRHQCRHDNLVSTLGFYMVWFLYEKSFLQTSIANWYCQHSHLFTNSDPERHLRPSRLIRVKLFALLKTRRGQVLWESRLNSSQDRLSSHHHNDLDVQISYELFREFEQIWIDKTRRICLAHKNAKRLVAWNQSLTHLPSCMYTDLSVSGLSVSSYLIKWLI